MHEHQNQHQRIKNDVLRYRFSYQILHKIRAKKEQMFYATNNFLNTDDSFYLIKFQNDDTQHRLKLHHLLQFYY